MLIKGCCIFWAPVVVFVVYFIKHRALLIALFYSVIVWLSLLDQNTNLIFLRIAHKIGFGCLIEQNNHTNRPDMFNHALQCMRFRLWKMGKPGSMTRIHNQWSQPWHHQNHCHFEAILGAKPPVRIGFKSNASVQTACIHRLACVRFWAIGRHPK